jgi:hypothetical protein
MVQTFRYLRLIPLCLLPALLNAQDPAPKFSFNGYASNMQSVMFSSVKGDFIADNLFHNRLNFAWHPNERFSTVLQLRNRLMYGQSLQVYPGFAESVDNEPYFLDLSMNILNEKSFLLNTTLDRAFLKYTAGKFVFTAGRQRINWGQTFVWNPNDLFNVSNFFDFDYEEKPGSDALRIQYYPGYASTMEIAARINADNEVTAAAYYRFNTWNYDFQVLGGIFEDKDLVAGMGWSGDIKGAGFRGEMSYFHPRHNPADTSGLFFMSVSVDYTFSNALYIQSEVLYNQFPKGFEVSDLISYFQGPLTVKKLSFSEWNLFASAAYPFSPLTSGSFAVMLFPGLDGFYAGPSLQHSLKDNMDLSLVSQVFNGKFGDTTRSSLAFVFLRYRLAF